MKNTYTIKQQPSDFVVKERITWKHGYGEYYYYWLTKTDYTTAKALQVLSNKFSVPLKFFSFAGNKDKVAITKQLISVKGKKIPEWEGEQIALEFVGRGASPISLGTNKGNHFAIVVRNIEVLPTISPSFVNYFGDQRFSENNEVVGKALLKRDWQGALVLLREQKRVTPAMDDALARQPHNVIDALRAIGKNGLRFFVHAYQSQLWNELAAECVKRSIKVKKLPILGFGSDPHDAHVQELIGIILQKEGINERDFINKQVPELTVEGAVREVYAQANNLTISGLSPDELNAGKHKVKLTFDLDSGCYATEFIRQNFST